MSATCTETCKDRGHSGHSIAFHKRLQENLTLLPGAFAMKELLKPAYSTVGMDNIQIRLTDRQVRAQSYRLSVTVEGQVQ